MQQTKRSSLHLTIMKLSDFVIMKDEYKAPSTEMVIEYIFEVVCTSFDGNDKTEMFHFEDGEVI